MAKSRGSTNISAGILCVITAPAVYWRPVADGGPWSPSGMYTSESGPFRISRAQALKQIERNRTSPSGNWLRVIEENE